MKSLVILLIPLLQMLSKGTASGYNQPRLFQGFSTVRPIYIDPIKLDPNRRYARSVSTDYETFIDGTVMPIIQKELYKVFGEDYNKVERVNSEIGQNRVARSLKDNPFKRPPPNRPIRFRRELKHRGFKDDDEINVKLANRPHRPTHDKTNNHNRQRRDLMNGYKKPTHHDVIIPNWNPRARTHPWQTIPVRSRRSANLEQQINDDFTQLESQSRIARNLNRVYEKPDILINRPTFPRPDTAPAYSGASKM